MSIVDVSAYRRRGNFLAMDNTAAPSQPTPTKEGAVNTVTFRIEIPANLTRLPDETARPQTVTLPEKSS